MNKFTIAVILLAFSGTGAIAEEVSMRDQLAAKGLFEYRCHAVIEKHFRQMARSIFAEDETDALKLYLRLIDAHGSHGKITGRTDGFPSYDREITSINCQPSKY